MSTSIDASLASLQRLFCSRIFPHEEWHDWALAVALALPHFLYAFIWFFPNKWRAVFGKESVQAFAFAGLMGKVLQFEAVLLWVWSARPTGVCLDLQHIELWQWLTFLLLTAFGQALNVGIYKAIGTAGVYYGFKLGHTVPWVHGFPFNVVSHPQYVGSAASVWGVAAILVAQMPTVALSTSVVWVAVGWTLLYVATGIIEQHL